VALALKIGTPVVLLAASPAARQFFSDLGGVVLLADSAEEAVSVARELLQGDSRS
jgi:hypothetical protein